MGSKRFPGKVLSLVDGVPLVVHVWRRVRAATSLDAVYVATDDDAVADAIAQVGGEVLRTTGVHRCGTDRVAEAVKSIDAEVVINVQADCAHLDVAIIDEIVEQLGEHEHAVVTPVSPLTDAELVASPDCVKAVVDRRGRGVYFSRAPVPHNGPWFKHVGVYGFRREALEAFAALGPSPLELTEDLEQLRLIENGLAIQTILTDASGISVDSPSDLQRLRVHHSSHNRGTHA